MLTRETTPPSPRTTYPKTRTTDGLIFPNLLITLYRRKQPYQSSPQIRKGENAPETHHFNLPETVKRVQLNIPPSAKQPPRVGQSVR